jgi:hypothetical protein
VSSPEQTLRGSCRQQRSVRSAPTVACGLGPCCSGSWTGPAAKKAVAAAAVVVGHLAEGSDVAAAVAVAAVEEGGCCCSLYSSRTMIRYCLQMSYRLDNNSLASTLYRDRKRRRMRGQCELWPLSSWWEQESHNSQGVADKSTCLPELTPAHTQLKNLYNYNLTKAILFADCCLEY